MQDSAASLDGLNLSSSERLAVEAGGQVIAVEEDSLGGSDRAELGAGVAANTRVGLDGLAQRAKLLGVVAVGAECGVGRAAGKG